MWGVMGGGVGGSGAVGAVGAQEGADWYKMFRLCEGHTHFCPRTWKEEEEVWGLRARVRVRGGRLQIHQVCVAGTDGGLHTHLSLSGDARKRRGRFPSAPEPAEHEPHRWRKKATKTNRRTSEQPISKPATSCNHLGRRPLAKFAQIGSKSSTEVVENAFSLLSRGCTPCELKCV